MIVIDLNHEGRQRRISVDADSLTIGRARTCRLRISGPGIAPEHCTLQLEAVKRSGRRGKKWVLNLRDHQISEVPTLVNGIEVIQAQLARGDEIRIGKTRLKILDTGATGAAAPAPVLTPGPAASSDTPLYTAASPAAAAEAAPPPRRPTTRRIRPVDPGEVASPAVSRTLGWLVTGMAAAIVVLVLLMTQNRTPNPDRTAALEGGHGNGKTAADLRVYPDPTPAGGARSSAALGAGAGVAGKQEPGTAGAPEAEAHEASRGTPTAGGPAPSPGAAPAGGERRGPTPERLGKREIYLAALEADRLARENDLAAAAEAYRNLIPRTDLPRLADELRDRLLDLERLAKAQEELTVRLGVEGRDDRPTIAARGRRVTVLGARPGQGVVVDLNGEVVLPWRNVDARSMAGLLPWAFPGAEGYVLRGLYLFQFKADFEKDPQLEELCHAGLQRALELEPARIQEINAILGRGLGVTSPTGFVYHDGRFMTPERRDRLAVLAEAKKQLSNLASGKPEVRRAAYAHLHAVQDLEMYQLFRKVLEARRRLLAKQLAASPTGKKLLALRQDKTKFLEKRKALLDMIFDTYNYPYPFQPGRGATQEEYQRYLASQDKIDDATRELWKIWESAKGQFVLGKSFVGDYALLQEVQTELDKFKPDEVAPVSEDEAIAALGDVTYYTEHFRSKVTLATLPMDLAERQLIEYNERVMAYNAGLESDATKVERQQVEVTNRYRNLLGRRALMLNNRLLASARGHSRDMVVRGYFAHEAPDPERRTPRLRMKLAGYDIKDGSENIARGVSGAEAVHERWRHSSGHHRNLLGKGWLELGSGNVGAYWTQNFGSRGLDLYAVLAGAKEDAKRDGKKSSASRPRKTASTAQ